MSAYETMLRLMNLPSFYDGVVRTSDGHYIAKKAGDLGYNHFLGKPSPVHDGPGLQRALSIWEELTPAEREAVHAVAASPGDGSSIPLGRDFGIPDV